MTKSQKFIVHIKLAYMPDRQQNLSKLRGNERQQRFD